MGKIVRKHLALHLEIHKHKKKQKIDHLHTQLVINHRIALKRYMHLRSGQHLGVETSLETASRVPTLGSEIRSMGNLETIREDSSSDSYSDLQMESEMSMGDYSRESDLRHSPSQQSRGM